MEHNAFWVNESSIYSFKFKGNILQNCHYSSVVTAKLILHRCDIVRMSLCLFCKDYKAAKEREETLCKANETLQRQEMHLTLLQYSLLFLVLLQ